MRLKTRLEITGVAAIPKSQRRKAFREGITEAGKEWHSDMLPRHFLQSAHSRYGYTRRDPTYRRRKRAGATIIMRGDPIKSIGEDKPLVWSGRSRERATSQQKVRGIAKSADQFRAEIILNAPALNFRYRGSQINMREEVLAITPAENARLERTFAQESQRALTRLGSTKKIIRRVAA